MQGPAQKRSKCHIYKLCNADYYKISIILKKGDKEHFQEECKTFLIKKSTKTTLEGEKQNFQCKHPGCPKKFYILHDSTSLEDKYFTSDNSHDLDSHTQATEKGIKSEEKVIIRSIFDSGLTKPLQINSELIRQGRPEQKLSILRNFLQTLRREKYGENVNFLNELEKWALANTQSDGIHSPYVLAQNFSYHERYFCLFVVTNNLLVNCTRAEIIQADSTFKLNWCGFPVIVVGTTDQNRVIPENFEF